MTIDAQDDAPPVPNETPDPVHDRLYEQAAAARHGGSAYAPDGERSHAQKVHDAREFMDFLATVSRAEGYAAGFEAGHRAGRHHAYLTVGPRHLADAIERDLEVLRRDIEAAGVCCAAERES